MSTTVSNSSVTPSYACIVRGQDSFGRVYEGVGHNSNGDLVANAMEASLPALPGVIDYINNYRIDWTISYANDYYVPVGSTDSRMYVTLSTPCPDADGNYFETAYDISCKAATGKGDAISAMNSIWNEFTDRQVHRKPKDGWNRQDNHRMTYWLPENQCTPYYGDMLRLNGNGTGQCGAWAFLLRACLLVQGMCDPGNPVVEPQIIELQKDPTGPFFDASAFLVKTWEVQSLGTSPNPRYPFRLYSELLDKDGVEGQGNPNPPGHFGNHFITRINGVYYDPSYGGPPYANTHLHEEGSIDGFMAPSTSYGALHDPGIQELLYNQIYP